MNPGGDATAPGQPALEVRIVAVGSELLDGDRADTNSPWLAARLSDCGARVAGIEIVPDSVERIAAAVRARPLAGLLLVCGGLGPTADDRTRAGIALALGRALVRDAAAEAAIRARLAAVSRTPGEGQLGQADLPAGAVPIDNPVGVAPGFLCEGDEWTVAALPGVPRELKAIFDASIAALVLAQRRHAFARRVLKVAGRTESYVDGRVRDLLGADSPDWTILATETGVQLVLRRSAESEASAAALLEPVERQVRSLLGDDVYGAGAETLPSVVGASLAARSRTVGCAESCTAGLLSGALTEVPGSSAWFRGGVVAYADDLKASLALVPEVLLAAHGAVSSEVAAALADGARRVTSADYGVGITGIAGPGGGTAEKPVGLVHVAVAGPDGAIRARTANLLGDRETVRRRTVLLALDELRRTILELP